MRVGDRLCKALALSEHFFEYFGGILDKLGTNRSKQAFFGRDAHAFERADVADE